MKTGPEKPSEVRVALAAAGRPIMVESDSQLARAAKVWRRRSVLGVDTEFVRERTYRAELGLVQVSDAQSVWLIDPLAVGSLDPLRQMLRDEGIEKVLHSGSEDFEVLHHSLGVTPRAMIDSQIACALLGQSLQLAYNLAAKWLLDVDVEKDHTRSNWTKRPLSPGQCRYAALDVVLLPLMIEPLKASLDELGRWPWLLEDVARIQRKSVEDVDPEEAWMRVRGAGSLDDAQRRSLQALAAWRERLARERNLARTFVLTDAAMLEIARRQPADGSELEQVSEIHPRAMARHGETWLRMIRQAERSGRSVPPLPQHDNRQRRWLKQMRRRVAEVAGELKVDAAVLASRKELERLVIRYSESVDVPERFEGWRKEVITDALLEIMSD